MNNTVLLSGKGWSAEILFIMLKSSYPDSQIVERKLRWWQFKPTFDMRIQNMSYAEYQMLKQELIRFWPMSTPIHVQMF